VKILIGLARFAAGLSLSLWCSTGAFAQTSQKPPEKPPEAAVMFAEYGRIGGCDHSARLDNMAITVQNNPDLEGYLIYYGPESASEATFAHMKSYLINSRGIGEERWKTIYAGPNSDPSEPRIQLWVAPRGASLPDLVRYESKGNTFNGMFFEHERWDGIDLGGDGEATGPPIPAVAFPTFTDMLKKRKDTLGYIVAFSGTESAPAAWRRVAQLESEELQSNGVPPGRIKTIYAGSDKNAKRTRLQFWILPENDPAPVANAGPEPAPTDTRQMGDFGGYELGDKRGERWAFNAMLDALRVSGDLRVCIIVRLEKEAVAEESGQDEEESEITQEETPLATDLLHMPDPVLELQRPDFLKLADTWKAELMEKHKIRPDRIIVLFAKPREDYGNRLETWVVPNGALLPDPDAEPPDEGADAPEPLPDLKPLGPGV
jgi:hypothetical protein